jgi:hypothetical protein
MQTQSTLRMRNFPTGISIFRKYHRILRILKVGCRLIGR